MRALGPVGVEHPAVLPDEVDDVGKSDIGACFAGFLSSGEYVLISPLPCAASCSPPPDLAATRGEPLTLLLPLLLLSLGAILVRRWFTGARVPKQL